MNLYQRTYNMAYIICQLIEEHNKIEGRKVFKSHEQQGKFIESLAQKMGAEISYGPEDERPEAWDWVFFDRFEYRVHLTDYIDPKTNKPGKAYEGIMDTLEEVGANEDIKLPKSTSVSILSNDYGVEVDYQHKLLNGKKLSLACPEYPIEAFSTDCFGQVMLIDTKPSVLTDIKGKHTTKNSMASAIPTFAAQQYELNKKVVAKLIEGTIEKGKTK